MDALIKFIDREELISYAIAIIGNLISCESSISKVNMIMLFLWDDFNILQMNRFYLKEECFRVYHKQSIVWDKMSDLKHFGVFQICLVEMKKKFNKF